MIKKPYVIVINAISGGGKTTITKELQKKLPNSKAIYFDDRDYDSDSGIVDICKWVEEGADVNLFDLNLLAEDIEMLIKDTPDFIVMDYPFGYRHNLISKFIDFSIFIDTPLDIALARRIVRDYDNTTIFNIFDDLNQYLAQGRNAYLNGLDSSKLNADFVVDGSKSVSDIVTSIYKKILDKYVGFYHLDNNQ